MNYESLINPFFTIQNQGLVANKAPSVLEMLCEIAKSVVAGNGYRNAQT